MLAVHFWNGNGKAKEVLVLRNDGPDLPTGKLSCVEKFFL